MLQLLNINRETLEKHITWKNHSIIAKFRIIKGYKGNLSLENLVLIFRGNRSQMFFLDSCP